MNTSSKLLTSPSEILTAQRNQDSPRDVIVGPGPMPPAQGGAHSATLLGIDQERLEVAGQGLAVRTLLFDQDRRARARERARVMKLVVVGRKAHAHAAQPVDG